MSLALPLGMDDLERLQGLFPTVDGDVVAIVFNEYNHDGGFDSSVFAYMTKSRAYQPAEAGRGNATSV